MGLVNFKKGMMYRKVFFVSKQEKTTTSLSDLGQKKIMFKDTAKFRSIQVCVRNVQNTGMEFPCYT